MIIYLIDDLEFVPHKQTRQTATGEMVQLGLFKQREAEEPKGNNPAGADEELKGMQFPVFRG